MARSPAVLTLAAALLATAGGCRLWDRDRPSSCVTSGVRADPPCRLTGRPADACYDPCIVLPAPGGASGGPAMVVPGGGYPTTPTPRPDELPFPAPSDTIPRPNVPFAPPTPAPGDTLGGKGGTVQPVKGK